MLRALSLLLPAPPSLLERLAPEPGRSGTISLGPLTLSQNGLFGRVVGAAATVLLAVILLRLVPVLERFIIHRAKRNTAEHEHDDESTAELAQRVETLTRVTGSVARGIIWSVTLIVILGTIGLSVTPLLAGAGIAGVAVGFGAQSIIKDFFAGFFILLENQFSVGDTVTIAGVTGMVEQMTLRITVLRDMNGTAYFIPNSSITTVANRTLGWVRVMLDTPWSAAVPADKARAVLEAAAKRIDGMDDMKEALLEAVAVEGPLDLAGGAVSYRLVAKAHADRRAAEVRQALISGLQAELFMRGFGYEGAVIVERARSGD